MVGTTGFEQEHRAVISMGYNSYGKIMAKLEGGMVGLDLFPTPFLGAYRGGAGVIKILIPEYCWP
jgi:hypothetical protein